MKALFIASHCDDELCFAGAMQKFESTYLAFSNCGSHDLHSECIKSLVKLKVEQFEILDFPVRKFMKHRHKIANKLFNHGLGEFDYVFTHSPLDRHPDHRVIGEESRRIFNGNLITYLAPWNGTHEENYFIELTGEQIEKKINALWCYRSQAHRKYMDSDFIRSQAVYQGLRCGKKYAEAYQIHRMIF